MAHLLIALLAGLIAYVIAKLFRADHNIALAIGVIVAILAYIGAASL